MEKKLTHKIICNYTLNLLTGLHIGDSKESSDIGGVDSPVIRNKVTNIPYIPGSSLKGKIRSLLELAYGKNVDTDFYNDGSTICELFGAREYKAKNMPNLPSRIIFRDADLINVKELENSKYTDMPFTEIKFENVIDRLNGVTKKGGIRQIERVPAGAKFRMGVIINIMSKDANEANQLKDKYLKLLKTGIDLLEKDYLGGSGSRGYGQVKIALEKEEVIDIDALIKQ